jgi:uncharacterized protein YuzE
VAAKLNITYDRIGDILYLETVKPYPEQETKHLGSDVLGRINPRTGAIENIEILFFTKRAKKKNGFGLPVFAELRTSARTPGSSRNGNRKPKSRRSGRGRRVER